MEARLVVTGSQKGIKASLVGTVQKSEGIS